MAIEQRPAGTGVILLTFVLAGWLEVLPLPQALALFRPEWVALAVVYWVIALPHRVGVFWGFSAGLFMDVLTGALLGQYALSYSVLAWLALLLYKRMRVFAPIQQSVVVFAMVGASVLLAYQIQGAIGRAHLLPWSMLLSALTSALLWRPAYNLLRWVRRRFLVR